MPRVGREQRVWAGSKREDGRKEKEKEKEKKKRRKEKKRKKEKKKRRRRRGSRRWSRAERGVDEKRRARGMRKIGKV